MSRVLLLAILVTLTCAGVGSAANIWCYADGDGTGVYSYTRPADSFGGTSYNFYMSSMHDLYIKGHFHSVWTSEPHVAYLAVYEWGGDDQCGGGTYEGSVATIASGESFKHHIYDGGANSTSVNMNVYNLPYTLTFVVSSAPFVEYTASGTTACVSNTSLWISNGAGHDFIDTTSASSYSFEILDGYSYRILFDGTYYDFTCDGDEVFDYDACTWVYGYTCGIDTIKLYKDDGGWALDDTESQGTSYENYEIQISSGDYIISFIDSGIVCHNQSFTCGSAGNHHHIDYDRCNWVYPPSPYAPPYIIYLWTGYDYNIVVFKDEHGNFIENSQVAIYDKTDDQYLQRWTDASDGYILLGAKFDTEHDVLLSLRTFDGVFTLATTYPANGSAAAGEEIVTTTNWTIPINYNLKVFPVSSTGAPLFNVFCGLSEYTPINPGAFWGMDLDERGYVAVTNCSGFGMYDIIAEKDGYVDFEIVASEWVTKSALIKDYRHNIIMEEV